MNDPPEAVPDLLLGQPYPERYKSASEEIPFFEGKTSFTAVSFITKAQRAFKTWGIQEQHKVKLALTRIGGEATKFETDLYKDTDEALLTFEDFERKLHSRFPAIPEDTAAFMLVHKTKLQGANLAHFIQAFNKQLSRAGPAETAWKDFQEELFLSGLGHLRPMVVQARPEGGWADIQALQTTAVAVHAAANLNKASQPSGSGSGSGSHNSAVGSGSQKRSGSQIQNPPGTKKTRMAEQAAAKRSLFCNNCQIQGHSEEECRRKARKEYGPIQPKGAGPKNSSASPCQGKGEARIKAQRYHTSHSTAFQCPLL